MPAVQGVSLDSRRVESGQLYAALPGAITHGARFAQQAVANGAVAILTDPAGARMLGVADVPVVEVADPRGILGELAAHIYDHPAEKLQLIGITGTNGKTTMTHLMKAGLDAAGRHTGIIGTTGIVLGDTRLPSPRTTPESPDLHAILADMAAQGADTVAIEVSSHALRLGRVDGLRFDIAVFTNLTQDHLDFHADMEDYFSAKSELFTTTRASRAVICIDDSWGQRLLARTSLPAVSYATSRAADWVLDEVQDSVSGWSARVRGPGTALTLSSRMPGSFNQANALGALATLATLGYDAAVVGAGIAGCPGVPGRMEPVTVGDRTGIVDYAHTPDAVERAIAATRRFTAGRLVVVLGCGGDRDAEKRPAMGRVAAQGSDVLVITDDNPRSEDPAVIRAAMLSGARSASTPGEILVEGDRRAAIATAVRLAGDNGGVLLLGKGHETGQEIAGCVEPFDDREVLAEFLGAMT
ncbi:MAG: UDP-N-acetylmuramoyl-L-alanyl-D-glutamate--2,6-diaminopimelate ligase [Actinobacteria bacterium]|nr:UDP-N-acetylmuramoyl-L-alanyl-D-glutamate--2,6-diaminopimelate ligase [Actinomycetota bacterium]